MTSKSATTGYAGLDWGQITGATSTVNLSGTTIATTQKVDVETIKTNPVVNAGTITFPTGATLASTTNITAGTVTTATNVTNAVTVGTINSGVITATSIAADAITAAKLAADVTTEIQSGLATASALSTATGYIDTEVAAIKAKTDQLSFTVSGQVDSNIQYVNDVQIKGTGASGNEWGPI